jgi:hypothetical protein
MVWVILCDVDCCCRAGISGNGPKKISAVELKSAQELLYSPNVVCDALGHRWSLLFSVLLKLDGCAIIGEGKEKK